MTSGGCTDSTCTNATNGCFTCQPVCYSEQSLCTISGQSASDYASHSWPSSFSHDQVIYHVLPQSVFNSALSYVSEALGAGTKKNTAYWSESPETRDFIYADKVNALLDGLRLFQSSSGVPGNVRGGPDGDIITASFFSSIASALNSAQIADDACNDCNVSCDVDCKDCQGCVDCEGCNTCQGYTTCHGPCHNPCHSPCDSD